MSRKDCLERSRIRHFDISVASEIIRSVLIPEAIRRQRHAVRRAMVPFPARVVRVAVKRPVRHKAVGQGAGSRFRAILITPNIYIVTIYTNISRIISCSCNKTIISFINAKNSLV